MRNLLSWMTGAGDAVLSVLLPTESADASTDDRYICYDKQVAGCGHGFSECGIGRLRRIIQHCCIDDYTGQVAWCDPERIVCDC